VALSRGLPRVGVTHHRALWSPDFPRRLHAAITRPTRPRTADDVIQRRHQDLLASMGDLLDRQESGQVCSKHFHQ